MPKVLIALLFVSWLLGVDTTKLPLVGVKVKEGNQTVTIEREIDPKCLNLAMNEESLWGGDFAHDALSQSCKKSFVTTQGVIQPFKLHKEIETYGELEVLEFILHKSSKAPQNYLLVDSRPANWFNHSTIPSAINIPFDELTVDEDFKEEYRRAYQTLGVAIHEKKFDFTNAKEILLFCNGSWCTQSPRAIETLLEVGYPPRKIKWYRGGITAWGSVGLTLIKKQ